MERRAAARVSEAQWNILLEFLERNPSLARARGYNNSAQGRAESSRLWLELAELLNAEGTGTCKTSKEWSVYVSNYKSRLKKIVADINTEANATGGGPPRISPLSNIENRFLAIMGQGFGQGAPQVRVNPFPDDMPTNSATPPTIHMNAEVQEIEVITVEGMALTESGCRSPIRIQPHIEIGAASSPSQESASISNSAQADAASVRLPRRSRQTRYRSRPLAPLEEARRVLSQVEMQRAAADAATARALELMAQNIGRLADAAERYLSYLDPT